MIRRYNRKIRARWKRAVPGIRRYDRSVGTTNPVRSERSVSRCRVYNILSGRVLGRPENGRLYEVITR